MPSVRPLRSLSAHLALMITLLSLLLGALLLWAGMRATEEGLLAAAEQRARDLDLALAARFAPVAAAGRWREALPGLRQLRGQLGLTYLVLQDAEHREQAVAGQAGRVPLPPPSASVFRAYVQGNRYDGEVTLERGDNRVGYVRYGYSLEFVREARAGLARTGIALIGAVALLGVGLAALLARGLRRRLKELARALGTLAAGGKAARLPARGPSEIAELVRAANESARAIEQGFLSLGAREARFRAVAECAYGVEAWFNPQGRLVWISRSIERITGFTPLECVLAGNLIEMLVCQKDRKFAEDEGRSALRGRSGDNLELRLQRKDGSLVWVAANWQAIHDANGKYLGLRVSMDDVQARKEAEIRLLDTVAELRRAQSLKEFYLTRANEERARLEALLDVMKVGVLFVDRERRVLFCNKALYQIWHVPQRTILTGLREETLLGRTALLRGDDAAYRRHIAEVIEQTGTSAPFEFALKDGRTLMDMSTLVPGPAPGEFIGRVWIYEDITEQKRIADRLIQLAERDPLTNLYNRRRFHEELERMLADAGRRGVQLGLLVVDLDNFKPINDRHGHQAGDTVLITLADDVGATVRRNEMFFRIGGDEFAILASDSSEEEMVELARRILFKVTGMRFRFGGEEARLTASVGIALYPTHGDTGKELVEHGDQAMYRAKTGGKNRWQVWRSRNAA